MLLTTPSNGVVRGKHLVLNSAKMILKLDIILPVQVECLEERIKQLEGYETGALIRRYDKELQHLRTTFQSEQARLQVTVRDVQQALSEAKREGADWETKCAELERRWSEERGAGVNGAGVNGAGEMFEERGRGRNDAGEWLAGEGCNDRGGGKGLEDIDAEREGLRRENEGLRGEVEGLGEENEGVRQENEGLRHENEDCRQKNEGFGQGTKKSGHESEGFRPGTEDLRQVNKGLMGGSGAESNVKKTVLQSDGELVAARRRIEELQNLLGVFQKEKEEFQKQLASARGEQGEGARLKAEADTWKEKSAVLAWQMNDQKGNSLRLEPEGSPREELDNSVETRLRHGREECSGMWEGGSAEKSEQSMLLGAAQEEIEKLQEVRFEPFDVNMQVYCCLKCHCSDQTVDMV